jgi:hypothetical protein
VGGGTADPGTGTTGAGGGVGGGTADVTYAAVITGEGGGVGGGTADVSYTPGIVDACTEGGFGDGFPESFDGTLTMFGEEGDVSIVTEGPNSWHYGVNFPEAFPELSVLVIVLGCVDGQLTMSFFMNGSLGPVGSVGNIEPDLVDIPGKHIRYPWPATVYGAGGDLDLFWT